VIRVPGYTPEEKIEIARSHLVPRQIEAHGLPPDRIRWSAGALIDMVTGYTRESGVRHLERQIATICRKSARRAAEGDESPIVISRRSLGTYLGPPPFLSDEPSTQGEVGVVNGLAWTESGGEVLTVEATLRRGAGLVLTGQLGDVMKESAQTALTYARGCGAEFGFDEVLFARHELHVHVPAGAIPKDGPSAGIAMATTIVSLVTKVPVRSDVAMTGEITLRGRVLPVGGVREKALAALRAGLSRVILPRKNLRDLDEIPRDLKRKITFIAVDHMDEVLDAALDHKPERRKAAPPPPRGRAASPVASARSR
jgi:ATP-dependent Lon protease